MTGLTIDELEPDEFRPRYAYHLRRLARFLGVPAIEQSLDVLESDRALLDSLELAARDVPFFRKKDWPDFLELGLYRVVLHSIAYTLRPRVFIETGVLHGMTSAVILSGLRDGGGRLVSIDYPSYFDSGPSNQDGYTDTLPPAHEPGWMVSAALRPNWRLLLGRSVDVLPGLLAELDTIDVFLHDSEHTYSTMWSECALAWPRLRPGGLLIVDNAVQNTSFFDFCREVDRVPLMFPNGNPQTPRRDVRFGLIRK